MVITSKDNSKYKYWLKLKNKKYRKINQQFIIEGDHIIQEAIKARVLSEIILKEGVTCSYNQPTTTLSAQLFEKLTTTVTSAGMIGICEVKDLPIDNDHRLLLIDDVKDPGNLGTLIRSALAFNFSGIVLSPESADIYNDKVIRATQGAIFKLPIMRHDLSIYVDQLNKMGVNTYVTHLTPEAKNIETITPSEKMAFIVGNEATGVSTDLINSSRYKVIIKMNDAVESLNVGVAGSIIMQRFNGFK